MNIIKRNSMKNFNLWNEIGKSKNIDYIADSILTNRTCEDFYSDEWLYSSYLDKIDINTDSVSILDFGCGIGRNTFGMSYYNSNWTIVGYDNKYMIEHVTEYHSIKYPGNPYPNNLKFEYEWDKVKLLKFDFIICCVVLQHIFEKDLNEYISDFKKMTRNLIVSGRRFNDDNRKNTWEILENNGLIPYRCLKNGVGDVKYEKDGDPDEHLTYIYKL